MHPAHGCTWGCHRGERRNQQKSSSAFLDRYLLSPACWGAPLRAHSSVVHSYGLWNPTLLEEWVWTATRQGSHRLDTVLALLWSLSFCTSKALRQISSWILLSSQDQVISGQVRSQGHQLAPRLWMAEWGNASHAHHGNPALTQSRIASCLLSFMFYCPVDTLLKEKCQWP